jgi:hypothetical protein
MITAIIGRRIARNNSKSKCRLSIIVRLSKPVIPDLCPHNLPFEPCNIEFKKRVPLLVKLRSNCNLFGLSQFRKKPVITLNDQGVAVVCWLDCSKGYYFALIKTDPNWAPIDSSQKLTSLQAKNYILSVLRVIA